MFQIVLIRLQLLSHRLVMVAVYLALCCAWSVVPGWHHLVYSTRPLFQLLFLPQSFSPFSLVCRMLALLSGNAITQIYPLHVYDIDTNHQILSNRIHLPCFMLIIPIQSIIVIHSTKNRCRLR